MSPNPSQTPSDIPVDEEQLSAFLDGELSLEESARMQSALDEKVAATDRVEAWKQIGHDIRRAAQAVTSPESASGIMERVRREAATVGTASVSPATHSKHDAVSGQRRVIAVISALALTLVCGVSLVLVNEARRESASPPLADRGGEAADTSVAIGTWEGVDAQLPSESRAPFDELSNSGAMAPAQPTLSGSATDDSALALAATQFDFQLVCIQVDDPSVAIDRIHQSMNPNGLLLSMPDEAGEVDDSATQGERVAVYFDTDPFQTRRLLTDLFPDTEGFRPMDWEPVNLEIGTRDEIIHAVIQAIVEPESSTDIFGRPFLVQTADASEHFPGYREIIRSAEIELAVTRNRVLDAAEQREPSQELPIASHRDRQPVAGTSLPGEGTGRRAKDREEILESATKPGEQALAANDFRFRKLDESAPQRGQHGTLQQQLDYYVQRPARFAENADSGSSNAPRSVAGVVLLLETRSQSEKPDRSKDLNYRLPFPELNEPVRKIADRS